MKKRSGVSKKSLIAEIALPIPTKSTITVGYMYDNLLKSYRAAVKLNNQSEWELSEKDIDEGRRSLKERLLLRCPYFFQVKNILGDRPDVRPPAIYGSGTGETKRTGVDSLLSAMVTPTNAMETRESMFAVKTNRDEGEEEVAKEKVAKEVKEDKKEEDEDFEANPRTTRSLAGSTNKRKGGSTALIDAVSILASAKSEGEARKFDFLSEHLQQQGELQRQELDLKRERLAIKREKNIAEQKGAEMIIRKLLGEEIGPHGMGKRAKTHSSKEGDVDIIELDRS
ncbi:hypothetical protein HOY82DRAFT_535028 [Tuber indicum]|nr:hypothetical protein HOY82DRAFT_535028 [Tuber indicum]